MGLVEPGTTPWHIVCTIDDRTGTLSRAAPWSALASGSDVYDLAPAVIALQLVCTLPRSFRRCVTPTLVRVRPRRPARRPGGVPS